jgi:hypothetical protein
MSASAEAEEAAGPAAGQAGAAAAPPLSWLDKDLFGCLTLDVPRASHASAGPGGDGKGQSALCEICGLAYELVGSSKRDLRIHVAGHYARKLLGQLPAADEKLPASGCVFCGSAACSLVITTSQRSAVSGLVYKVSIDKRHNDCFGFVPIRMGDYHQPTSTPQWKGNVPVVCPVCKAVVARFCLQGHFEAAGHAVPVPPELAVTESELNEARTAAASVRSKGGKRRADGEPGGAGAAGAGHGAGGASGAGQPDAEPLLFDAAAFSVGSRVDKFMGAFGPATVVSLRPGISRHSKKGSAITTTYYKIVYDELLDEGTGEQRYEDLEEADLRLLPREMDPKVAVEEECKPRPVGGSDRVLRIAVGRADVMDYRAMNSAKPVVNPGRR